MLSKVVTGLLFIGVVSAADYNYNRCDKTNGPAGWKSACQNVNTGTPINLCGATSFTGTAPAITLAGYDAARTLQIFNTGSTIQVNMPDTTATLSAGTLATTVGRSTSTTAISWVLGQIHFHWGRTGLTNEGSEHYMQGKAYPFEAHYVHYNSAYTSVATAAGSGATDALLVVGVFMDVAATESALITGIGAAVKTATKTATAMSSPLLINELFSSTGNFYSYAGGLTTPTCNEIVTWIVMTDVKSITLATLNLFKAASTSPSLVAQKFMLLADAEVQGKYGNFRPLQGTGARKLYIKTGTSDACSTVTSPSFVCSAGFITSPSLIFHILAASVALMLARN